MKFRLFFIFCLCYDLGVDFPYFIKMIIKGGYMKKKLLVLLIAVIPTLMPNLASAIAIELPDMGDLLEGKINPIMRC